MKKGKTYKHRSNYLKIKCLQITPRGNALCSLNNGNEVLIEPSIFSMYEEYKEPKEYWVNIYSDNSNPHFESRNAVLYKTREAALAAIVKGYPSLATKKISWTEGDSE